jgi:Cu/Ag efflux protein CusF
MKSLTFLIVGIALTFAAACGPAADNRPANETAVVTTTPVATTSVPKNGDYPGKGKVTKVDPRNGAIEIDHEAIIDVIPAKKTELYVIDSEILKGIKVGDNVDFVLRYKDGQQIFTEVTKQR